MRQNIKTKEFWFYIIFSVIPPLCIIMDWILSVVLPDKTTDNLSRNIDISLINQIIYYSIWYSISITIFGILNLLKLANPNMSGWISSKNNCIFIFVNTLVIFIVYNATLIISSSSVAGFNNWYKILKSVLEHMLVPIIYFIFFFTKRFEKRSTKEYMKYYALITLIMPIFYILFIFIRVVLLHNYMDDNDPLLFTPFPYVQIDPYSAPVYLWLPVIFLILAFLYGLAVLTNYSLNLIEDKRLSKEKIKLQKD